MTVDNFLQLYGDYLQVSDGLATTTNIGRVCNITHDKITRFLSSGQLNEVLMEQTVLQTAIQLSSPEGVLIFDDMILHKPYSEQSPLISYHFDHTQGRAVKGMNLLTGLYYTGPSVSRSV